MSRKLKLLLILRLAVICLLSGCAKWGNSFQEPVAPTMNSSSAGDLEGYVTKKEAKRILVVSTKKKDLSSLGGIKEYYDAVWVSKAPKEFEVGQTVRVWFKGEIATSYPGQGTASKVVIVPNAKHEGAVMSEEQAIQKAIRDNPETRAFVVNQLDLDAKLKQWTILYKDGFLAGEEIKQESYTFRDLVED